MRFYIVRHGESEANVAFHQGQLVGVQPPDSPLSKSGLEQAERLAERFAKLPVDLIISSDFTRALTTADIIAKKIHKPHVIEPALQEIAHPKDYDRWQKEFHTDPFLAQKEKALAALHYLEDQRAENIVIVTHSALIRMLICLMPMGQDLIQDEYFKFGAFMNSNNTGVTMCDLNDGIWRLQTWNDHSHLVELINTQ